MTINNKVITRNGKRYRACEIAYNKNEYISFVIDDDDWNKVNKPNYNWRYVNTGQYGYIACDVDKNILYLHNLVMNRLTFTGKGSTESIDHISRNGRDNTKENLRLVNQSEQNYNQKARDRTIILPKDCGFTSDDVPKNVHIKPAYKKNNTNIKIKDEDRIIKRLWVDVIIEKALPNGDDIIWHSTSDMTVSLKFKLEQAKKYLRKCRNEYPKLFKQRNIECDYNDEAINLIKNYNAIISAANFNSCNSNLIPVPIKSDKLIENLTGLTDIEIEKLHDDSCIEGTNNRAFFSNLPKDCILTRDMIPSSCHYVPETTKYGGYFVIRSAIDPIKMDNKSWKTQQHKDMDILVKYKQMMDKLKEIEGPKKYANNYKDIITKLKKIEDDNGVINPTVDNTIENYKVTVDEENYRVCCTTFKDDKKTFVIDDIIWEKIKPYSWRYINGDIGRYYRKEGDTKTNSVILLKNVIIENLEPTERIQFISEYKGDLRNDNLKIIDSSAKNDNKPRGQRGAKLPKDAKFTWDSVPKYVIPAMDKKNNRYQFVAKFKNVPNPNKDNKVENINLSSTSSNTVSTNFKIEQIKKRLRELRVTYPDLFISKNIDCDYNDEQITNIKKYNKIITSSKIDSFADYLLPVPKKIDLLKENLSILTNDEKIRLLNNNNNYDDDNDNDDNDDNDKNIEIAATTVKSEKTIVNKNKTINADDIIVNKGKPVKTVKSDDIIVNKGRTSKTTESDDIIVNKGKPVKTAKSDDIIVNKGTPTKTTKSDDIIVNKGKPVKTAKSDDIIVNKGTPTKTTKSDDIIVNKGKPTKTTKSDDIIVNKGKPTKTVKSDDIIVNKDKTSKTTESDDIIVNKGKTTKTAKNEELAAKNAEWAAKNAAELKYLKQTYPNIFNNMPTHCNYENANGTKGGRFVIRAAHPNSGGKAWKSHRSKDISFMDKYNEMVAQLKEITKKSSTKSLNKS